MRRCRPASQWHLTQMRPRSQHLTLRVARRTCIGWQTGWPPWVSRRGDGIHPASVLTPPDSSWSPQATTPGGGDLKPRGRCAEERRRSRVVRSAPSATWPVRAIRSCVLRPASPATRGSFTRRFQRRPLTFIRACGARSICRFVTLSDGLVRASSRPLAAVTMRTINALAETVIGVFHPHDS